MTQLRKLLDERAERGSPRGVATVFANALSAAHLQPAPAPSRARTGLALAGAVIVVLAVAGVLAAREPKSEIEGVATSPEAASSVLPGPTLKGAVVVTADRFDGTGTAPSARRLVVRAHDSQGGGDDRFVAGQVIRPGEGAVLEMPPVDPGGEQVSLGSIVATRTDQAFTLEGIDQLSWELQTGERVRLTGRGVDLVAVAEVVVEPDIGLDLDELSVMSLPGLDLRYDGPDAGNVLPATHNLQVAGTIDTEQVTVEISTSPAPFDPLAAFPVAGNADLVDVRGRSALLQRSPEGSVLLRWAERDDLSVSVAAQGVGEDDFLAAAEDVRLVTAEEWERYVGGAPSAGETATTTPSPETITPSSPSTLPATRTARFAAVSVWTGGARGSGGGGAPNLLVWGGEAAGDGSGRADGFFVDPATGNGGDIPAAPIAPRASAAGVWTGEELLVCCGRPAGRGPANDTTSAAAYSGATGQWRTLAPPPAGSGSYTLPGVWTGSEMLVVSTPGELAAGAPRLLAYDPAADEWRRLADPPTTVTRAAESTWTGRELVVWPELGGGLRYDPGANRWEPLPELPDGVGLQRASAVWTGEQLVVWGVDAKERDERRGFRLGRDDMWRPMAAIPLPPLEVYEGTPGSQTLVADPETGRVVVWPAHGYELGGGGVVDEPMIPLFSYDPGTDAWERIGVASLGYHPDLRIGGRYLLRPDREDPVVIELPG